MSKAKVTYPDLQVSLLHGLQREERRPTLAVRFLGLAVPAVVLLVVQGLVMDEHIRLQFRQSFITFAAHLIYYYYCMYVCMYEVNASIAVMKISLLHRSAL
jgi:hypothetical protein